MNGNEYFQMQILSKVQGILLLHDQYQASNNYLTKKIYKRQ